MEKKVTSYRLPISTLKKLDLLLASYEKKRNELLTQYDYAATKLTRGDLLDMFICQEYEKMMDEDKSE